MRAIYSFGISAYSSAIGLASLFSKKAKQWKEGRKNIFERLEESLSQEKNIVWFHCASLGEFEQGRPLIEAYKRENPQDKILLTFFSPSGYEIRKNYEGADFVFYLPMDSRTNARRFVSVVQPKTVFFIKYEFWFNYLYEIKRNNIACFLVSGIFRKDQLFFKSYGKWAIKQLTAFTHFFLQNNESAAILEKFGFVNFSVTGDTRFDRVISIAQNARNLPQIERFSAGAFTVIFGSSWPEEDEIALRLAKEKTFDGKIIIAPHEIGKEKIKKLVEDFEGQALLWSERGGQNDIQQSKVLIIDSIGLLSSIYQYGDVAVIGGGFGKGVHNVLEAATFGLPIFVGPNYQKFQEVKQLIELGAAMEVDSVKSFQSQFLELYDDKRLLEQKSALAKKYVQEQAGATERIIGFLVSSV